MQELAAHKVDIVKIWVDDWRGKYKKLTPEIYGAIIDEAHKRGLRVTAHIFELEDAKGLIRAGLDAFAHGVRDKDIDDEFVAMLKQRPNLVLIPNLPDRGVKTDLSWLKGGHARRRAGQARKGQRRQSADAIRSSASRRATWRKLNAAGVRITMGTDGNRPWGPHVEMEDMVAAGMTPAQVIVAATRNGAEFLQAQRPGHAGGRQERRLHRARRQSAGRHHQHAEDFVGGVARRGGGSLQAGAVRVKSRR